MNNFEDFDVYLKQGNPDKKDCAEAWKTAIGLQAVDGLFPSQYLMDTAKRNIEGDITIDEVKDLIDRYYQSQTLRTEQEKGTKEADNASVNITKLINEKTFTFSPVGYIAIHKRIFSGILDFAGKIRDYNITKKEWVLRGDTVLYANSDEIMAALEHDFSKEKEFNYHDISLDDMIRHFVEFISNIWQVHAFGEGNTRTTAVFTIKYLRAIGFDVNNNLFADNSWYFRNALVRANYRNYQKNIIPTSEYLILFFRNLLLNENNELKNRYLIIDAPDKYPTSTRQVISQESDKLNNVNVNIIKLIKIIGEEQLSVKKMLELLNLKNRENFLDNYLNLAINENYICQLYPDKPKHPKQKYLLTEKGLILFRSIK